MLTETDKYKLSLYVEKEKIHISNNCNIYLTQSSLDNKLYIKRVYENSNMLELFNTIKNKGVRNTPQIYEVFYDGENTIVIEEYILGHTADSVNLTKSILYKLIDRLLLSVKDLHSINIIHRDIKPSNIIIIGDYRAYLIDFGIARFHSEILDSDTTQFGTKGFASPEQYGFQQTDFRSDIYSIGKTIEALIKANNIKCNLKKIVSKSISFDPKDRYNSVSEMKRAVIISKYGISFSVVTTLIFVLALIIVLKNNHNKVELHTEQTTTDITIADTTTEYTTATQTTTVLQTEEQTTKVSSQNTVSTENKAVAQNSQPKAVQQNKSTTSKPQSVNYKNVNVIKSGNAKLYYSGLKTPANADCMEMLKNETHKTCSIAMNNAYVTVECIKNNSNLTVNLSDNLGHKNSLSMSFSDVQLKNCQNPNNHGFNAYIFFTDYNGDGNTDIFVNFTDAAQSINEEGNPVSVDYGNGSEPYIVHNWNSLKLVEHTSEKGFYTYKEVITTSAGSMFEVGGNYKGSIYCNEYSTLYVPSNGVITEKMA